MVMLAINGENHKKKKPEKVLSLNSSITTDVWNFYYDFPFFKF